MTVCVRLAWGTCARGDAYLHTGHVIVERSAIVFIEDPGQSDPDRRKVHSEFRDRAIPGHGDAWPRIRKTYAKGEQDPALVWVVLQHRNDR